MKKKVLLLMTSHYSIYKEILENLERMGYEVDYRDIKEFKYKSFTQRAYNFFRKTFLRDKKYKDYLRKKTIEQDLIETFGKDYFDYTLIIRPDIYNPETVHFLKKISKKVVAYQWDGFSRFYNPPDLIEAFDTFAVFDKKDYYENRDKHKNLILAHNFYFDIIDCPNKKTIDVIYIGAKERDRVEVLNHLANIFDNQGIKSELYLFTADKVKCHPTIKVSEKILPYRKVLEKSSSSKCVIDLKHHLHDGLSLRFFESLYFNQKIITDNQSVKHMDFYHPNNILIVSDWYSLSYIELEKFLNKPFVDISEDIKNKYSFESWFNRLIQ
ncbi:hypothetical protein [Riemerella columbipharyngis]|uniref:Lipopolysaccharide biosynthesis protein n=1 Tax=Riemerella columbipharyngis TaxID=1071918 RepID=A0A1G7E6E6_9FLAO|nr:hypothetical protein [Riemerella columbipharyngis]SDE59261.1 hypothetical protein SAMN05421544_11438 [Riemerella columbipharyngis]